MVEAAVAASCPTGGSKAGAGPPDLAPLRALLSNADDLDARNVRTVSDRLKSIEGRGLHSSTSQLNLSRSCH